MPWRFLLPLLLVILAPAGVCAHSIDMEWKQIGERITIEAFFDDDTPVRSGRVQILDGKNEVVVSGATDVSGKCTLRAPNPGQYQLVVDAGAGHRKQRGITVVGTLPVESPTVEPPIEPAANTVVSSGGADRQQATGFPWDRAAIGCGIIALVAGAWWLSRRSKPPLAA